MRLRALGLCVAACVALTGCGAASGLASLLPSLGPGGEATTAGTPAPAPLPTSEATLAERHPIDVCAIVTMADAQSKSPFQTPLAYLNEQVNSPFGCGWTSSVDPPSKRTVSIDLIANSLGTAEEAAKEFAGRQQDFRDLDFALSDAPGLGDRAFDYQDAAGDYVGTVAQTGEFEVRAELRGEWLDSYSPKVSPQQRIAAAHELITMVMARL